MLAWRTAWVGPAHRIPKGDAPAERDIGNRVDGGGLEGNLLLSSVTILNNIAFEFKINNLESPICS